MHKMRISNWTCIWNIPILNSKLLKSISESDDINEIIKTVKCNIELENKQAISKCSSRNKAWKVSKKAVSWHVWARETQPCRFKRTIRVHRLLQNHSPIWPRTNDGFLASLSGSQDFYRTMLSHVASHGFIVVAPWVSHLCSAALIMALS